jgi:hypothetical protein
VPLINGTPIPLDNQAEIVEEVSRGTVHIYSKGNLDEHRYIFKDSKNLSGHHG